MIDPAKVQALKRELTISEERLYALIDAASLPGLLPLLAKQSLTYVSLLPGQLDPELASAAPYLVQLSPRAPLLDLFLTQGMGGHWGVLVQSRADFRVLRMHFRGLLSVWDPDGKPLLFRYYDPRVLRVYLPTCTPAELDTVFGPAATFYAEAPEVTALIRFRVSDTGLGQELLSLSPSVSS